MVHRHLLPIIPEKPFYVLRVLMNIEGGSFVVSPIKSTRAIGPRRPTLGQLDRRLLPLTIRLALRSYDKVMRTSSFFIAPANHTFLRRAQV